MKIVPDRDSDIARFWSNVALPDSSGCMRWLAKARDKDGYGRFAVRLSNGDKAPRLGMTAQRFACFVAYGEPESPELQAAHNCTTKDCVAPGHLAWATPTKNQADRLRDDTHSRGTRQRTAKLKDAEVWEIFSSTEPASVIAPRYGISQSMVWNIRGGFAKSHITGKVR